MNNLRLLSDRPQNTGKPSKTIGGELLDVRGVALFCGGAATVTESAVRHWIERGHLPALKIGGRIFVRRASLERFLEQKEREFAHARGTGA